MTHPPQPPGPGPGPTGPPSHEATQAFPAGGAPPPPPPEPAPGPGAPPAAAPPSHEATQAFPVGGAPPAPPPDPGGQDPTRSYPGAAGAGPVLPGPAPAGPAPHPGYGPTGYGPGPAAAPQAPPPPQAAPPASRHGTGRIVGRALLVLVVVGALVGATAWGFVNRRSAEQWRDRTEAAEEDLTRSLERVEATDSDLEEARVRLRELANEKAGEVDENRILSEIVAQAPEVTAALADCQAETAALANDLIAAFGNPEAADVSGLQARTDEVNEICAEALDQAEALEATIDGLG